jgi:hypothetical protein
MDSFNLNFNLNFNFKLRSWKELPLSNLPGLDRLQAPQLAGTAPTPKD